MATAATTARDLSANRDVIEESIEDALGARLAMVLAGCGFANDAAGAYAEVLATRLASTATGLLFELHENDAALRVATAA